MTDTVRNYRDAFEKRVAASAEHEAARRRVVAAEELVAECRKAEETARDALLREAAGVVE